MSAEIPTTGQRFRRLKKAVKWSAIALIALIAVGFGYEQISRYSLDSNRPPAEQFCDLGTHRLHFVKKGEGGPTVIFESGLGQDDVVWAVVQEDIARDTTTISYDRAGLLWSERGQNEKTIANISLELSQLLEKTNCPKPYVLVGHSLAGVMLRPFIRDHSDDIAAVIFVDVSHPLQLKKVSKELLAQNPQPSELVIKTVSELGIFRSMFPWLVPSSNVLAEQQHNQHLRDYFYKCSGATFEEARNVEQMFADAEKIDTFGSVPLTVITGTSKSRTDVIQGEALKTEFMELWLSLQKDLLNLSTQSTQVEAANSGHMVQLQEPDIVIKAIRDAIQRQRESNLSP